MTSNEAASAIQAFIQSYRAAFERLDAAAVADHFAYPSYIASDGDEVALISIVSKLDCLEAMEKVLVMHRQLGTPSGRIFDLSIAELSPRLAQASLRMVVSDSAANVLYDFESIYTLAKVRGSWRIASISHNQIPRLLACLARYRASSKSD